jgi:hypothetical protein
MKPVVITIIIVVFLALAGVGAFLFTRKKSTTPSTTLVPNNADSSKPQTVAEIAIAAVQEAAASNPSNPLVTTNVLPPPPPVKLSAVQQQKKDSFSTGRQLVAAWADEMVEQIDSNFFATEVAEFNKIPNAQIRNGILAVSIAPQKGLFQAIKAKASADQDLTSFESGTYFIRTILDEPTLAAYFGKTSIDKIPPFNDAYGAMNANPNNAKVFRDKATAMARYSADWAKGL